MTRLEDAAGGVADELDALGPVWRWTIVENEPGVERRPGVVRLLLALAGVAAAGNNIDLDAAASLSELQSAALDMTSGERRDVIAALYSAAVQWPIAWSNYLDSVARLLAAAEDETVNARQRKDLT